MAKVISEHIKTGNFKPVYLLYGPEAYLRRDFIRRMLGVLRPQEEGPSLNYMKFVGPATSVDEVVELAQTPPFFAQRRIIHLEDTGFFKNAQDKLSEYMKNLPDYLVMIFDEAEADKRTKLYKAVAKYGHVEVFDTLRPGELTVWVERVLAREKKQISKADAQAFVARVGSDMWQIRTELDKLIAYTGDRPQILWEDVEAICTVSLQDRVFDMIGAITGREQEKALALYYDLLALKEPPLKILVLLGREYVRLLKAKDLMVRGDTGDMAGKIGVNPYFLRKVESCAASYRLDQLEAILKEIVEADEGIKTGRISDQLAMETLIVRLSGGAG